MLEGVFSAAEMHSVVACAPYDTAVPVTGSTHDEESQFLKWLLSLLYSHVFIPLLSEHQLYFKLLSNSVLSSSQASEVDEINMAA